MMSKYYTKNRLKVNQLIKLKMPYNLYYVKSDKSHDSFYP